ncbi:MAG: site-specific integrase [Amphritea sp.]|nr:site-specific integrase [Amphritea sp.]
MKFKSMAQEWLEANAAKWQAKTRTDIERQFEKYVYPEIGGKDVADLKIRDFRELIISIEEISTDLSHRIMSRIVQIMHRAVVFEYAEHNTAISIQTILRPHKISGFQFLTPAEMPRFCNTIENTQYRDTVKAGLWTIIYTAQRLSEIINMKWSEISFDDALITIPAERMKQRKEHLVPLPNQLLRLLISIKKRQEIESDYVFTCLNYNKPIYRPATGRLIEKAGYSGRTTNHGFRKTFSTFASDSGLWSVDAVESQLSHSIAGVRGIYNKSDFLQERRRMMQWYADQVDKWRGSLAS